MLRDIKFRKLGKIHNLNSYLLLGQMGENDIALVRHEHVTLKVVYKSPPQASRFTLSYTTKLKLAVRQSCRENTSKEDEVTEP